MTYSDVDITPDNPYINVEIFESDAKPLFYAMSGMTDNNLYIAPPQFRIKQLEEAFGQDLLMGANGLYAIYNKVESW